MHWSRAARTSSALVGNLPVERALADPGATGDRLDRRLRPELAVDLPRGTQDPLCVARGIGAQRPVSHRGHGPSITDC